MAKGSRCRVCALLVPLALAALWISSSSPQLGLLIHGNPSPQSPTPLQATIPRYGLQPLFRLGSGAGPSVTRLPGRVTEALFREDHNATDSPPWRYLPEADAQLKPLHASPASNSSLGPLREGTVDPADPESRARGTYLQDLQRPRFNPTRDGLNQANATHARALLAFVHETF